MSFVTPKRKVKKGALVSRMVDDEPTQRMVDDKLDIQKQLVETDRTMDDLDERPRAKQSKKGKKERLRASVSEEDSTSPVATVSSGGEDAQLHLHCSEEVAPRDETPFEDAVDSVDMEPESQAPSGESRVERPMEEPDDELLEAQPAPPCYEAADVDEFAVDTLEPRGAPANPLELVLTPAPEGVAMPGRTASASDHASTDSHADRRIMGAAATLGGAAGMVLMGPVSAAALGAAAAYASTREDGAGTVTRKAGVAYLRLADKAVDEGLRVADKAVDEGRKRFAKGLESIDTSKAPAPLRAPLRTGLRKLQNMAEEGYNTGGCGAAVREEARRMREQYPDRVPVICEKSPYCELPEIDKRKFAVPGTMLCGEFKYIVHKHVAEAMGKNLRMEQTIYVFVNGIAPKTSTPMSELYEQLRADDGFLYVRYGAENTLGASSETRCDRRHCWPGSILNDA
jgi:GABA(A) receptor-associated protein